MGRIKSIPIIPKEGIIYYVKEVEFRSIFNKDNVIDKESIIYKLFRDVYDICQFDYSSESEIRDFYIIKSYGSFIHKILEKPFIYDQTPEINSRLRNHEQITNIIINLYENQDKYNSLPKELENNDIM